MEMFGVVERWINSRPDKDRVLQGLTKEGVRSGRHYDSARKNALGGYAATGGHSHGGGQNPLGGYIPQSQGIMPGYGNQGGGGTGTYVQSVQNTFAGSHGGSGGGVSSYIQQAGQAFQGGGSGVGGFVQNVTDQMVGGRRLVVNDNLNRSGLPVDLPGSGPRPPYPLEPQYSGSREQYGRPIPPYPRTPPIPQDYSQTPLESQYGQSLYGYSTQAPKRQRPPYPDN
jgi:hypothetical protein